MWSAAVTLFPEMLQVLRQGGMTKRALETGIFHFECYNPRDFTQDVHKTVDDRPYGGGPGMVMKPQPLWEAVKAAQLAAPAPAPVIYMSPQGKPLNQATIEAWAKLPALIFIAGRYEGIDQRFIESVVTEECSLGDYILSGGEPAILVIMDALMRLLPGVLGNEASTATESFVDGRLEYPQYTRPEEWQGLKVPPVLLQGHHQAIEQWRLKQQLGRTWLRRPDLLAKAHLSEHEEKLLQGFIDGS